MTEPSASLWTEAIAMILGGAGGCVVVVGGADAGKSTFCCLLLRAAVEHGRDAALIDADVGQKMVGLPATVTSSNAEAPDVVAGLAFVGTTDPAAGLRGIVSGLGALRQQVRADLVVVNTSGLLAGRIGRRLKAAKITVVEPDLLVALGEDSAVDAVLADHSTIPFLRLPSSPEARRKGPGRRRAARRDAFRRYLEEGTLHDLSLPDGDRLLAERQLVGLVDQRGCDIALGLVEAVDLAGRRARLRSPARLGSVHRLVTSQIRLDENYDPLVPCAWSS
jgi:polynucleotide 5'-hydroxyl-kinase GRC3/NOL9